MTIQAMALLGDYWHPADVLEKGIQQALPESVCTMEILHGYQQIPWDRLNTYDLIVLAQWGKISHDQADDSNLWMDAELQEKLAAYVENGGGLLVLHCGLANQPEDGVYRKVVKGHFIHHPKEHPTIHVKSTGIAHPVLNEVSDFEIVDEQYFVACDAADTTVLLTGSSEEFGASAAAWVHSYGKGRVCGLTPGHTEEVLAHPDMKKLLYNAVVWCAGQ